MRAAVVLACGAALFLLAGCGSDEEPAAGLIGRKIAASATLDPTVHVFAEPVTARIEVVVDREQVHPDRVRVETSFLPYDIEAEHASSVERGRLTVLRREYVLRCLRVACIPEILQSAAGEAETGRGERRTIRLPAARVLYEDDEGESQVLQKAAWPEVVSVSRLKQSDVPEFDRFIFKVGVMPLADLDYRVSPTVLAIAFLAGAAALLALPVTLVARWYRRRRPVQVVAEEPELTPLERAIRLVEWASTRENGTERREALEVLAVELEAVDRPELARSSRELAWSQPSPANGRTNELLEDVRSVDVTG